MSTDKSIDELLARAILDIELKMKHEIRQNNALQLAKMEKQHQQVEKRLSYIEAKLEALLNRETNSVGSAHRNSHYHSSSRQQSASAGRTSYYARTANLASGFRHGQNRPMGSPVATAQPYGVFGSGVAATAAGSIMSPIGRPHQHKFVPEKKQLTHRPKQTLGTGGNKTQLGEFKNTSWTAKIGIYTDDDESGDEGNQMRSASEDEDESHYSVAKPDDDIDKPVQGDDGNQLQNTTSEMENEPRYSVAKPDDDIEKPMPVVNDDETEQPHNEESKPLDAVEIKEADSVTTFGGFGKSRRN